MGGSNYRKTIAQHGLIGLKSLAVATSIVYFK